jgi:hypothetical protein
LNWSRHVISHIANEMDFIVFDCVSRQAHLDEIAIAAAIEKSPQESTTKRLRNRCNNAMIEIHEKCCELPGISF